MKKLLLSLILLASFTIHGQLYFPPTSGSTWATTDPLTLGYCQPNIDEFHDYLDQTNSKAFILLKDGKIVFEWYYDTFTKDSLWVWNSAGKTLTSMAVGIAQREGYLDIHDTTSHYLGQGWTSLTPQQEEKITIWNQLTMTTGLNHTGDHYCTDPDCLVYIAEPGTRWMYHNAPYTLLDGVIEAATGGNLNTYVTQKIKNPTGMNGMYFPSGYNNVFVSTPRSMARYGLLLLNGGTWDQTPVLDDAAYFQAMINTSQSLNPSYGYLTWLNGKGSYMLPSPTVQYTVSTDMVPAAPDDMYAALGKDGQIINVVPSQNLVFIRMGEGDGTSLVGNQYNDTIWQKINQLSCTGNTQDYIKEQTRVYPVPALNKLNIVSESAVISSKITDINGKLIANFKDEKELNIESLTKGFYFIEIKNEFGLSTIKFIKE